MKKVSTINEIKDLGINAKVQYKSRSMYIECIVPSKFYRVYSYHSIVGYIEMAYNKPDMFITSPSITNEWLWNARYNGSNGGTTNRQISMLCNECHLVRLVESTNRLRALEIDYLYVNRTIQESM